MDTDPFKLPNSESEDKYCFINDAIARIDPIELAEPNSAKQNLKSEPNQYWLDPSSYLSEFGQKTCTVDDIVVKMEQPEEKKLDISETKDQPSHKSDKLQEFESLECLPDVPVLVEVKNDVILTQRENEDLSSEQEDKIDYKVFREDLGVGKEVISHKDETSGDSFICVLCNHKSDNKQAHKKHMFIHKNPLDTRMFKCNECNYQCKREYYLERHLLKHKIPPEIIHYICPDCTYQTTKKQYFQQHLQVHKNPSEDSLFTCSECPYKTSTKRYFQRHMLSHNSVAVVRKFKLCDLDNENNEKGSADKDALEVEMVKADDIDLQSLVKAPTEDPDGEFKCTECNFHTRYKGTIQKHVLKHRAPSVVTRLTCSECNYQTMDISNLRRHLHIHKVATDAQMYKCTECNYETKLKEYLQKHQRIHRDPSKATTYSCKECSFTTLNKSYFQRHQQLHKGATMFKCSSCNYQCKLREYLRKHELRHKEQTDQKLFKCTECNYESKDRSNLAKHRNTKHVHPIKNPKKRSRK